MSLVSWVVSLPAYFSLPSILVQVNLNFIFQKKKRLYRIVRREGEEENVGRVEWKWVSGGGGCCDTGIVARRKREVYSLEIAALLKRQEAELDVAELRFAQRQQEHIWACTGGAPVGQPTLGLSRAVSSPYCGWLWVTNTKQTGMPSGPHCRPTVKPYYIHTWV